MSEISAATVSEWLKNYSAVISEHANELTDLDRQIGDADHGSNMARGMTAVAALDPEPFASAAGLLKKAGMTLVSTVGGASGPLYSTFFLRLSTVIKTDGEPTAQLLADALDAGLAGIVARGKAEVGDKTLVDALSPAVDAAKQVAADDGSAAEALAKAAEAANEGRDATIEMVARRGRASYLGERSKGHQDPGATSMALLVASAAHCLSGDNDDSDATAVSAAIEKVGNCDGILVLVDIGSAILSAEMALDLLDADIASKVKISTAPLVEGAVVAAVMASTGAELEVVAAEAEKALDPKVSQLSND